MTLLLGIDEAGKGPVIGPLVICGYVIDSKNNEKLRDLGVKDSKLLSPERRESIAKELKKICKDYIVIKLTPKQIDDKTLNLNKLEIKHIQKIIDMMEHNDVIIDAIEANTEKFAEKIRHGLKNNTKIIAENYADKNHLVVGAASIIAKTERDSEIKKLHKEFGFFGTGYPSDEKTINFLKKYFNKNNKFPDCVRNSWVTAKVIKKECQQKNILKWV